MDVIGGTKVGGTGHGWSFADPAVMAASMGAVIVTPQTFAPQSFTQPAIAAAEPTNYTVLPSGLVVPVANAASMGAFAGAGAVANATTVAGGGTVVGGTVSSSISGAVVGGSWSPEPAGNNQILYGRYDVASLGHFPTAATGAQGASPAAAPAATDAKAAEAAKAKSAKKPKVPETVTVKKGETAASLAKKYSLDPVKIQELNKKVITDPNAAIKSGQKIRLKK